MIDRGRRLVVEPMLVVCALSLAAAVGCGDDSSASPGTSNAKQTADAGASDTRDANDAAMAAGKHDSVPDDFMGDAGDGWKTLLTGHWEIEAGTETYRCVRFTLPEDVYAGSFRPLIPKGTHHTVLTIGDEPSAADGITKCSAQTNAQRNIGGSGVGTNDFVLPDGLAMRLRAGQQLLLNLHLFNVTDSQLVGTSGMLIKPVDEKDVTQLAEGVLAGPLALNIPVGGPTVQSGNCTFKEDGTIFATLPHMHQLGIHMKTTAHSSLDGDVVMHDGDYSFDEQVIYSFDKEVHMKAGDKVQIDCTYMNTTNKPVNWGDSSLAEMCFAGLFRYPATMGSFLCSN